MNTITYENKSPGIVIIKKFGQSDVTVDMPSYLKACQNIIAAKDDYTSEEFHRAHLAKYVNALVHFGHPLPTPHPIL